MGIEWRGCFGFGFMPASRSNLKEYQTKALFLIETIS